MNHTETQQEINQQFQHYIQAYFQERNLQTTLACLSPNLSGFGTGLDEVFPSELSIETLFQRDIEQAPNPFEVIYKFVNPHVVSETAGFVEAILTVESEILGQPVRLNNLRITLFFKKINGHWLVEHKHISLPTIIQEEGEASPIQKLEERNKLLEYMVQEKTKQLQHAIKRLKELSTTDPLTGLFNRAKFNEEIDKMATYLERYESIATIMMIDIDLFKHINDTFGHLQGDIVLKRFSKTLETTIRKADTLARWGGEEFIVLLPETDIEHARLLGKRIDQALITNAFKIDLPLTVSIGIAEFQKCETADHWLNRADQALYTAKRNGRNRIEVAE